VGGIVREPPEVKGGLRVALESLKSDYSWRPEHKTFQRLLREAAIGLVPEEEGIASLMYSL
jgi:hypothetical protein